MEYVFVVSIVDTSSSLPNDFDGLADWKDAAFTNQALQ